MQEEPARALEVGARIEARGRLRAGLPGAPGPRRWEEGGKGCPQLGGLRTPLAGGTRIFLFWGRGRVTGKSRAPGDCCASGDRAAKKLWGKRPRLPPGQSNPRANLGARFPGGLATRAHLRSAREVVGVSKAGAPTGQGEEMVEEGGRRREAAPGLPRKARGGTGAAGFLSNAGESRLPRPPRLSRSPATSFGLGRGRAGGAQG